MEKFPSALATMRLLKLVSLSLVAPVVPAVAQQILEQQPLPPIDIKQYAVEQTTADSGEAAYLHKVVIQDEMMEKSLSAVQLVFVGNDGFAVQSIHRATLSQPVDPEQQGSGAWTTPQGSAGQFAVLVEKVRYQDGEIWSAKHADMARAIQAIDPEFRPSRLQDEPRPAVVVEINIINIEVDGE